MSLYLYICKNISFPNHIFENYHIINIFSTIEREYLLFAKFINKNLLSL